MGITEIGTVVVVMLCGRSSQMLCLAGGLYIDVVIGGCTDYDASSNSSAFGSQQLIDRRSIIDSDYELNFSRLNIIVGNVSFSFIQVCQ